MNNLLTKTVHAHEGEEHIDAIDATSHYFDFLLNPYAAILAFIVLLMVFYGIMTKLKIDASHKALLILGFLLLGGVIGFVYVPPLGVVAITMGFALALLFVLVGVTKE